MKLLATITLLLVITIPTSAQAFTCESRCDGKRQDCKSYATGVYITCGQQGGSQSACAQQRGQAYADCMGNAGCYECYDARIGLLFYCLCGASWGGGGHGGGNIETYDYGYGGEVPFEFTWSGMGCNDWPELCDPSIWW